MGKLSYSRILRLTLAFLGIVAFFGAVVYRFYALDWIGVIITVVLSAAAFRPFMKLEFFDKEDFADDESASWRTSKNFYILAGAYVLLFVAAVYSLSAHRTAKAIISPWEVVPTYFFWIYGLATAALFAALLKPAREWMKVGLVSFHYFLSFSVALIVYKIGYGYDPFVHEATLKLIDINGAVFPKPYYYLGYYSLIIVSHKLLFIPIAWLNKALVPILAAIMLPAFINKTFTTVFGQNKLNILLPVLLLFLPFSFFILSTPQGLGYLFLIIVVVAGLEHGHKRSNLPFLFIMSASALACHPIAGIPALLFTLILLVYHKAAKYRKTLFALTYLAAALALPAAFFILDGGAFSWSWQSLAVDMPIMPWRENFVWNFIYLYGSNVEWAILILIIAGRVAFLKYKEDFKIFFLYGGMTLALFISYLITKNFSFGYLINYERSDFPDRILMTAVIFSIPFIAMTIYKIMNRLKDQDKFMIVSVSVFAVLALAASLYLSYPRFDKYFNSRGYSTGLNDIEAVMLIKKQAGPDYVVLSNQQVSAAALYEWGFDKYYKGNIFYYPVPTSGPLYQYYLDMVYKKPSRETMTKAMDLAGVREGYFVLNKYWWAFPKVLDEAKYAADKWWSVGNGDVYIFKYSK